MSTASRLRILSLLTAAALLAPVPAQAAPAKKAPAKSAAKPAAKTTAKPKQTTAAKPAQKPAQKPAGSVAKPAVAQGIADMPPLKKSDSAVLNHEKYPGFVNLLKEMVEKNIDDFSDAILYILEATGNDEHAVFSWMNEAAISGNLAALRWVVGQELSNVSIDKLLTSEPRSAYRRLTQIAAKGYLPARLDVASCLRLGLGTERDEAAAIRQLEEASKSGNFLARFQLLLATKSLNLFADKDKPEVTYEIDRGNHHVSYFVSTLATDTTTQMAWIRRAAEQGSGEAYFVLSSLASHGHPKDSYVLLEEAARLHHPNALFVLGDALCDTEGRIPQVRAAEVKPDPVRGMRLLKTSALLGNPNAAILLATAYHEGNMGLPQDDTKAFFHVSNPQVASNTACMSARGYMMLRGLGTKQNIPGGLDLLQQAVRTGYPMAFIYQAYANYKGLGMKEDAHAAANLLSEAAALGAPEAYVYQAFITAKGGAGLAANEAQAQRYIRLAAMDMGERAQQLYDSLILKGEWEPKI